MKKGLVLVLLAIFFSCGLLFADKNPRVLLLMQEKTNHLGFMIRNEVKQMINLLNEAGYDVTIATETGEKLGYGDVVTVPDLKFDQVNIAEYSGIIIPCMAVMETKETISPTAVKLVATAYSHGLPLAAQNSGVTILGQAGILKGRKYAIEDNFIYLVLGGIYQGKGIVRDGKIVTSGVCPWLAAEGKGKDGTSELTRTFIRMLQERDG